jgi:hypothetical protein
MSLDTGAGEKGVDRACGGTALEIPITTGISRIGTIRYFSIFTSLYWFAQKCGSTFRTTFYCKRERSSGEFNSAILVMGLATRRPRCDRRIDKMQTGQMA